MLLMASPESDDGLTRPFHAADVIVRSVHKLLEGYTEQAIWAEVQQLSRIALAYTKMLRCILCTADTRGMIACLMHAQSNAWVTQVLFPEVVAGLLLLVHGHMSSARHPRHAVRALAPLQALLQLLGPKVCEPATFRYTVHIVLQAMENV